MTKEEKYWVNRRLINDKIEKRCDLCKEWFEETSYNFYYLNKSKPERGFSSDCKQCAKKRARKWAVNNVEKKRESCRKNSRKPNILQYHKELSQRQRDSGMTKVWYQDKKDTYRGYVIKYESHKHHTISEKDWIRNKEFFDFKCAYCGISEAEHKEKYHQQLHKDHAYNEGDNGISNNVPACRSCNSSKRHRDWNVWFTEENPVYTIERHNKIKEWLESFNT